MVPNLFRLRAPWQPISINCTLHISKMFVINIVVVISNLYVVSKKQWSNFSCTLKCLGSYPWGHAFPRLGIIALSGNTRNNPDLPHRIFACSDINTSKFEHLVSVEKSRWKYKCTSKFKLPALSVTEHSNILNKPKKKIYDSSCQSTITMHKVPLSVA